MEIVPTYDTTDLEALAAMPELEAVPAPGAGGGDHDEYRAQYNLHRYVNWVNQARVLAAAGIRPGPSHRRWVAPDGTEHTAATVWGAFTDAEELDGTGRPGWAHKDPAVLFGTEVDPRDLQLPYMAPGYPWRAVAHQTAGMGCHHRYIVGIPLEIVEPKARAAVASVAGFADGGGHSCVGLGGITLSEIRRYGELVESLELNAETSWQALEEGCYPLDESCATTLSPTAVPSPEERSAPPDGDDSGIASLLRLRDALSTRWHLWILGENCD